MIHIKPTSIRVVQHDLLALCVVVVVGSWRLITLIVRIRFAAFDLFVLVVVDIVIQVLIIAV